ncbi:MAG: PAS domain S-box protein, partial [Proteobacteria bacterium]|nr:PAS domain S-box protein [Pseudomonadota bacterium]
MIQLLEDKYRLIAENSADVIWTMDMDMCFTYVSPAIYQLRGYTVEEALGHSIEETAPGSLEKIRDLYSEKLSAIQSGDPDGWKPIIFEVEQFHKDGRKIWTSNNARILQDRNGQPSGILGITRDITDRVLADQALRESEEKYRNLFEFSMDGVLLVDPEKGYLDCNMAAVNIFGLKSKEQLLKLNIGALSPEYQPDGILSSQKIIAYMEKVYKTGSNLFEWTYKHQDGYEFYTSVLVALMKIGGKNIVQVTMRDLSDYKRSQEIMVQSEKMMSVGGLAAGMAHEINNPM